MDQTFSIICSRTAGLTLRSINESDLEDLRNWKNDNRFSFFHTDLITAEQQIQWFRNYQDRPDDQMLIVYSGAEKIGCMGFRKLEQEIDVYNIIRGVAGKGNKGDMSIAFLTMCHYAWQQYQLPITVKVLKSNPAAGWYKMHGFQEISIQNDYFYSKLNPDHFRSYTFKTSK